MSNNLHQFINSIVGVGDPLFRLSLLFLWISAVILLISVVYKFVEYQDRDASDRQVNRKKHSVETFSMAIVIIAIFNLLQFRIGVFPVDPGTRILAVMFGGILAVAGIVLHLWSKRSIGVYWSNQIEIQKNHHLITTGPYSIVRHPMYSSVILWLIGAGMIFQNYTALAITLVMFIPMMRFRASAEDEVLRKMDSAGFAVYARSVKQLVPRFGLAMSILLRLIVIGMLGYSLVKGEMGPARIVLVAIAHLLTGIMLKVPKVRFAFVSKSIFTMVILGAMSVFPRAFWLFYIILVFDVWGLFANCPCMIVYQKYNGCPCFEMIKTCWLKMK